MKFLCRLLLIALLTTPLSTGAESIITETVHVPLHYRTLSSGEQKLGIYLTIGGGSTPQIFEFDTGGAGLYAAYATNNNSPWWGTGFTTTTNSVTNTYDSGIQYRGPIVEAPVSLFADHHGGTPLLTTPGNLLVGQMTNIANTNSDTVLWTPEGEGQPGVPPIDNVFYGDFGMSLNYASKGIVNLIAQLSFGDGIIPGFRIRAHGDNPFLQVGLTAADTTSASAFYFGMNTNTNAPPGATFTNSGSLFYSEQIFNANMTISNATTNFTANLGITTDTGASTTIHNANLGGVPDELLVTNTNNGKVHVVSGADFGLSGLTLGGTNTDFYQFVTSSDQISIQNNKPGNSNIFYLNSGIALFQQYDVIYNLQDGQIGFEAIPEPNTWALLGLGALVFVAVVRKSILNRRQQS